MCTIPLLTRICRESINDPQELYDTLRLRGMDLITVTDHDSIDAVESLRRYDDFFLSEEVTCHLPSGTELHVAVYDITERDHVELQRRRDDLPSFVAYCRQRDLLFCVNHMFSGLTGRRMRQDFEHFVQEFPAFETRNGTMLKIANQSAQDLAGRFRKVETGGSDAHTLKGAGKTYTQVSGARDVREFIQGLKAGRSSVAGKHGDSLQLTRILADIGLDMMSERAWTAVLLPLVAVLPAVTLINFVLEATFARTWALRTAGLSTVSTPVLSPEMALAPELE
jgi:predicted metal-dependent phosphoesterase TrpH